MTRDRVSFTLFLVLVATAVWGQTVTGIAPFTSQNSDAFDSTDFGSLNVHFEIPFVSKAGRGVAFQYSLRYDSSFWVPTTVGSAKYWQPETKWWGWSATVEPVGGYVTYKSQQMKCIPDNGSWYYYYKRTYSGYVDRGGVKHPFNLIVDDDDADECSPYPEYAQAIATDGSGLTLAASVVSTTATVTTREGELISAPLVAPLQEPSTTALIDKDDNGNKITSATVGGAFVVTDTLGVSALSISGTNPVSYSYPNPAGGTSTIVVHYTTKTIKTFFQCGSPQVNDYPATSASLITSIVLPGNGGQYTFTYEDTPNNPGYVTGRIKSVTLPTGGQISYTYTGTNAGIICTDGTTAGLTRPVTPGGAWTYSRSLVSGTNWKTTLSDPSTNQTVLNFQKVTALDGSSMYLETKRVVNTGASTVLRTIETCYNSGVPDCTGTPVTFPISTKTVTPRFPDTTGKTSQVVILINGYSLPTEIQEYDFGAVNSGSRGSLLRKTTIGYASLGNGITSRPSAVRVYDVSSNLKSETLYTYDEGTVTATSAPQHDAVTGSRGNPTTIKQLVSGTTYLTRTNTYFDTGLVKSATGVNGAITNFTYGVCGNAFATQIALPLSLTRSMTWDCDDGVMTSITDENGKNSTISYDDPNFWRPTSTQDAALVATTYTYPSATTVESSLTFNNGLSTVDVLKTVEGFGRPKLSQVLQAPSSSSYDSVQTVYDSLGRPQKTTLPYSGTAGQTNPSGPGVTTAYDTLNRPTQVSDSGSGTSAYSYSRNLVYVTVGPAPSGESTKRRQLEYDGLGRLTSVCEITSGTASGACDQGPDPDPIGYWTKYTYDTLGNLKTVTQNAQPGGTQQTRTFNYDMLGRMLSEINPETGTTTYVYDTDATCGTSAGDLVKRADAVGNVSCYAHDSLHRVTSITYPSGTYASRTPGKYFKYDAATVNGQTVANAKGRLAQAYTSGTMPFQNTDFEASSTIRPPGWVATSHVTLSYDTTTPYAGSRSLKITTTAQYAGAESTRFTGVPGKTYTVSGYAKSDGTCSQNIQIAFLNSAGQYLSGAQTGGGTQTTWQFRTATATSPANTVLVELNVANQAVGGAGVCEFDNITASGPISDEGFSYSARGELTDIYQATPNSGGYYTLCVRYWEHGPLRSLNCLPGIPYLKYGNDGTTLDGEGRPTSVWAQSGQSPVTAVSYVTSGTTQPIGAISQVTYGSGDSDSFQYDANTGRMTLQTSTVGPSQSVVRDLRWNAIGSLAHLYTTDPVNSSDPPTCNYTHDDLGRVNLADCGSYWHQTFAFDAFGNIDKTATAGISFLPTYTTNPPTNRYASISGCTPTYDANGNLTYDCTHTYTWDAEGRPHTIDGVTLVYDALNRAVEQQRSTGNTQIVYGPGSMKLALFNGQTLVKGFMPLPGGGTAVYTPGVLPAYYRHPDWLGSSRLATTPTRTNYYDGAYAPYGENHGGTGTTDLNFTGQNQDTVSGIYDFLYREYSPNHGRWMSPDPAGLAAVDPANPQSWNRYAYVRNSPLNFVDPLGLNVRFWDYDGGGGGAGGVCPAEYSAEQCGMGGGGIDIPIGGGGGGGGGASGGGTGGSAPSTTNTGSRPPLTGETLGIPNGLSMGSLNLCQIMGLCPIGAGCEFGTCTPIGDSFAGTGAINRSFHPWFLAWLQTLPLRRPVSPFTLPLPNIPPGPACKKYPLGVYRFVCDFEPDTPVNNCVRGYLLGSYEPGKGYEGGARNAHCNAFASCGMSPFNPVQIVFECYDPLAD